MTQTGGVHSCCLWLKLLLILAAVLHQGLATVAPPPAAQTTAAPQEDPGKPQKGRYLVRNSNGTACLLASMGLQLNITVIPMSQEESVQAVVNIPPNKTQISGLCGPKDAILQLVIDAEKTNLTFVFTLNSTSNKYHLSGVSLSAFWPDMKEPFSAQNSSLNYLRGTKGYSYMCREEQTLNVTKDFSINTFQVQLQPFGLTGEQFGTAEECLLDQDDMLIPIIIGAALAGLVLIVLLAYLIGRKRSHAGYQTI